VPKIMEMEICDPFRLQPREQNVCGPSLSDTGSDSIA
jgi:hypothetical protein